MLYYICHSIGGQDSYTCLYVLIIITQLHIHIDDIYYQYNATVAEWFPIIDQNRW
mgnify:CR=1 FL=1